MAILPLNPAGHELAQAALNQLHRDWRWLSTLTDIRLPFPPEGDTQMNDADWRELAGFAFAHRPAQSSLPALSRLLMSSPLPLQALRAWLQQGKGTAEIVQMLQLTGRRALLARWREETQQALKACGRGE